MLKMMQRLIGENIDLIWRPASNLWLVEMDPSQINQILANLCVNARDAIDGIGTVSIETSNRVIEESSCRDLESVEVGEYVLLVVNDNGCGMTEDAQAHLFEPFYTTKELGKGTGLGLATIYGIVTQNRGHIRVYSELGCGTTFTIYLPRHVSATRETMVHSAPSSQPLGIETILVAEDEPAIRILTIKVLERSGYTVLSASTPSEAIDLAQQYQSKIHLLLTDVIMPEMNGHALWKNLLTVYPRLKCLFMSGYTADVIAHHGVLEPGTNFIQKPFSVDELTARVRQALEDGPDMDAGHASR